MMQLLHRSCKPSLILDFQLLRLPLRRGRGVSTTTTTTTLCRPLLTSSLSVTSGGLRTPRCDRSTRTNTASATFASSSSSTTSSSHHSEDAAKTPAPYPRLFAPLDLGPDIGMLPNRALMGSMHTGLEGTSLPSWMGRVLGASESDSNEHHAERMDFANLPHRAGNPLFAVVRHGCPRLQHQRAKHAG